MVRYQCITGSCKSKGKKQKSEIFETREQAEKHLKDKHGFPIQLMNKIAIDASLLPLPEAEKNLTQKTISGE